MDCRTARLLLDYHRPQASELASSEAGALEQHLSVCSECDALTRAERQADARLGKAMRDVPIPDRLRDRVLARLHADRRAATLNRLAWSARAITILSSS